MQWLTSLIIGQCHNPWFITGHIKAILMLVGRKKCGGSGTAIGAQRLNKVDTTSVLWDKCFLQMERKDRFR